MLEHELRPKSDSGFSRRKFLTGEFLVHFLEEEKGSIEDVTGVLISLGVIGGLGYGVVRGFGWMIDQSRKSIAEQAQRALDNQENVFKVRGLLGEHELVSIGSTRDYETQGNLRGSLNGSFLLFLGDTKSALDGQLQQREISTIQFAWQTTTEHPQVIISEVPFDKAIFTIIDDSKDTPRHSVYFDLNPGSFLVKDGSGNFQSIDLVNPNEFLKKSEALSFVRFTLPKKEFSEIPTVAQLK